MKNSLAVAAVGQAITGLVLLVYPPIVVRLLFGAEIAGAGVVTEAAFPRHQFDRVWGFLLAGQRRDRSALWNADL